MKNERKNLGTNDFKIGWNVTVNSTEDNIWIVSVLRATLY